jgi:hypothetical protein
MATAAENLSVSVQDQDDQLGILQRRRIEVNKSHHNIGNLGLFSFTDFKVNNIHKLCTNYLSRG